MTGTMEYRFQFNNDEASARAFADLIASGWLLAGYDVGDGYKWFILRREA